ncbi:MAG: FYDLN acid domain-containing protein [Ruminococcus sp.]
MAKHACPSCGKRFDFEKNGWICPYCGSVVLQSMEQNVYAREQQAQSRKQQKQKRQAETLGETLRRRMALAAQVILVVGVILFGGAIFQRWNTLQQLEQSDISSMTEQTVSCGETISISPYTVQITEARWADQLPDFPAEVQAPTGGRYLTVSFTCSPYAESAGERSDILPDDAMWTCLDAGNGYLLPQYPANLTGSDAIERKLYDLGMGYQLDPHSSMLIFLVDEEVQTDQLALRIYTGDPMEQVDMKQNNADTCYVIPLEVTS